MRFYDPDYEYLRPIDYIVGDDICSKQNPDVLIGKCTNIKDNLIEINGKIYGGKWWFEKYGFTDYKIIQ